jgi:hypothetical protein
MFERLQPRLQFSGQQQAVALSRLVSSLLCLCFQLSLQCLRQYTPSLDQEAISGGYYRVDNKCFADKSD